MDWIQVLTIVISNISLMIGFTIVLFLKINKSGR